MPSHCAAENERRVNVKPRAALFLAYSFGILRISDQRKTKEVGVCDALSLSVLDFFQVDRIGPGLPALQAHGAARFVTTEVDRFTQ